MAKNNRTRCLCALFYEEDREQVTNYLKSYVDNGVIKFYAFIHHKAETEDKSAHYHALIEYYNAKTPSSVSKKIGVRDGKIEVCNDKRIYARYLLHMDDPDKISYQAFNIATNDPEYYRMLINASNDLEVTTDKQFLKKAYDLIKNKPDYAFYEIIEELVFDKNIDAVYVRRYTQHLHKYFESFRYYQHTERGVARYNNELDKYKLGRGDNNGESN